MDRYSGFDELKRHEKEGVDYRIRARLGYSGIAILSIHGGDIEPGTSQIADAIAGHEHTFYALEGIKSSGNLALHIKSTLFDEPNILEILGRTEITLSIHGCREKESIIHIGGLDLELRQRVLMGLRAAGFDARECSRPQLDGIEQANICNLCRRGMGVQLEISRGLRDRMFGDLTPQGRQVPTELFQRFVQAVRDALEPFRKPRGEWAVSAGSERLP